MGSKSARSPFFIMYFPSADTDLMMGLSKESAGTRTEILPEILPARFSAFIKFWPKLWNTLKAVLISTDSRSNVPLPRNDLSLFWSTKPFPETEPSIEFNFKALKLKIPGL